MLKLIVLIITFCANIYAAATPCDETFFGLRIPTDLRANPLWFGGIDRLDMEVIEASRLPFEALHTTPVSRDAFARQTQLLIELHGSEPLPELPSEPTLLNYALRPLLYLAATHKGSSAEEEEILPIMKLITAQKDMIDSHFLHNLIKTNVYLSNVKIPFDIQIDCIKKVHGHLKRPALVPVIGIGEMGLGFLIACQLTRTFTYSIYNKIVRVHGVDLSELGFTIHDFFHIQLAYNLQMIASDLELTIRNYETYNARELTTIYADILFKRIQLYRHALLSLLQHIIDTKNIKALVAMFIVTHETTMSYPYLESLSQFYQSFAKLGKDYYKFFMFTPEIESDYITGNIPLTDAEITDKVLQKEGISAESIENYTIIRTPRRLTIIDIEHKRTIYQDSLIRDKILDTEDLKKLVEIAGFTVSPLPSDDLMKQLPILYQTQLAMAYINSVCTHATSLLDYFSQFATDFAKDKESSFTQSLKELQEEFKEKLSTLTPSFDPKNEVETTQQVQEFQID